MYNLYMFEKDNKELLFLRNDFEIIKTVYTVDNIIKYYNILDVSNLKILDIEKSKFIEKLLIEKPLINVYADIGKNIQILNSNEYFTALFSFMKNEFELCGCQKLTELNGFTYKYLSVKFKNDLLQKEFNFYGYNDIVERVKDRVKDVEYLRLSDFLKKDIILPFPYDYENSETTLQEHITELESKPRSIYVNSIDGYNVAFSVNKNLNYVLSFMLGRNILVGNNEYAAYDELSQDMQAKIKSIRVRIKYTENLSDNIIQDFCKVKQHKPKNTRKPLFLY